VRSQPADHMLSFGRIYKCADAQDHYQVELVDGTGPNFDTERSFYFQVVGKNAYILTAISETQNPSCGGRDLLDEMGTK